MSKQKTKRGCFGILFLYDVEMSLASNNLVMLEEVKSWLSSKFQIKDIDETSYVLGVRISKKNQVKKRTYYLF